MRCFNRHAYHDCSAPERRLWHPRWCRTLSLHKVDRSRSKLVESVVRAGGIAHCHIIVGVQSGELRVRFIDSRDGNLAISLAGRRTGFWQILVHGAGVAMPTIHQELIM